MEIAAPALGQHSREILSSLGYADEEIERLCRAGAVGVAVNEPGA